jgi:hypothetical protein
MIRTCQYRNDQRLYTKAKIISATDTHVTAIMQEIVDGKVVGKETLTFDWDKIPFKITDTQKSKLLEATNESQNS